MLKCLLSKAMSQRPITSFFKPNQSVKRKLSETQANGDSSDESAKQQKTLQQQSKQSTISTVCDLSEMIAKQSAKTSALSPNIGHTWFRALRSEFSKPYFQQLSTFLESERNSSTIYPPIEQVFSLTASHLPNYINFYNNFNLCLGLAFSVRKGVAAPPSLLNMFKELESDINGFKKPNHGDLTGWANQGVLLLNACLTVKAHNANSHSNKGWEQFTDAVIKWLNSNLSGVVFLLWGSYAQKKGSVINKKKHLVLQSAHPSPLSAYRGFLGCKHFSSANDYLKKNGHKAIDWNDLP
ncbi:unnamed protein product [Medioppia subpectinata]|uniref:Uracil-DNA glycosylase n=1 Tax=Medioppia subpectinata TaxID=1979941 RepID=A0A7R9Q6U8_9ACAR|nr:unnamed protein product [Medioppia subpectinata]CAG2113657.1 unnamed protein product [Medioppia subpectinata]